MTTDTATAFEFDVALSFAGEDRAYVQDIAERLRSNNVRVFYDQYEQAKLWGKDLYEHLDYVYQRAAQYCLLFVSQNYAHKVWTNHERKSAQARALRENEEYVLPVRFDDTDIPGLRPTVSYIDARQITPGQLVELILAKLAGVLVPEPFSQALIGVPQSPDEERRLLVERPPAWRYLLFAGVLSQGKEALEPKWRDHQIRYVRRAGPLLDDSEAIKLVAPLMNEMGTIGGNLERVLDSRVQESAFGPSGDSANPAEIQHLAQRIIGIYEEFLDWSARVRGTAVSDELARLFELTADYANMPISQMREFIDQYVDQIGRLPERSADPSDTPIEISLLLKLDIDDQTSNDYDIEFERLKRKGLMG